MSKTPLAQQLLDAHVAHIMKRLEADRLEGEIERLVDQLLSFSGKLKLGTIVKRQDVVDTALDYAAKMEIAPAIPELVAEIARELYQHQAHDSACLNDLVTDHDFKDLLDKFGEMKELRERLIHEAVENPIYTALVSDLLYNGIDRYINDNPITNRLPGAKSMLKLGKSMIDRANPKIEAGIKHYINTNTRAALRESERFLTEYLESEQLEISATRIWERLKTEDISRFRDYVSEDDVEELFVIGFEFWRRFRTTDYYADLITAGVDFFFKKYGRTSLKTLLKELGVSRDMIVAEVQRYAPRIVAELNKHGFVEQLAHAQLESFYNSDELAAILASHE